MKAVIFIIAIGLLIGIGWYLMQPTTAPEEMNAPTTETDEMTEVTTEGEVEGDGDGADQVEPVAEPMDDSVSDEEAAQGDKGREEPVLDADVSVSSEADVAEPVEREFTIDAFNYGYSMDEIRVNEGDTVILTLTNSGGFHDWVVDEFAAATNQIAAGDTTTITFVADSAGTYEYYCSVGSHREQGMVGQLIVE